MCKAMATWLLHRVKMDLVSYEVGMQVRGEPYRCGWNGRIHYHWKGIQMDALGVKLGEHDKICVVECKTSRSDLLADLRARKMHGYSQVATHCYLALNTEIWFDSPAALRSRDERRKLVTWLAERGLPRYWGVVLVKPHGWMPESLRPVKAHACLLPGEGRRVLGAVGRNLSYRLLGVESNEQVASATSGDGL